MAPVQRQSAHLREAARQLRARFRADNLRADRRLGQHFLADLNLAAKIVDLLPPTTAGPVLEIGPGLGALTFLLLERGHQLLAVEIDPRLAGWLAEALEPWPAARIRQDDFCRLDLDALAAEMLRDAAPDNDSGKPPRLQVIGNLPYYATSEILLKLLAARRWLGDVVLTMQREVAARLTAPPGTRTYGSLSVACGRWATVESCVRLPATAFWPAPEVESTVVRLRWREATEIEPGVTDPVFERVVRAAFAQRRKRLENSLAMALGIDRKVAVAAATEASILPGSRAEDLSPADFARLALTLSMMVKELGSPGPENEPA